MYASLVIISVLSILASSGIAAPVPGHRHRPATAATSVLSGPELAASCAARPDKGEGDFFGGGPCAFVTDKPPATAVATTTPIVVAAPIATTKAATAATSVLSGPELAASCAARPDKGEGDFFGGGPCAFVTDKPPATAVATATPTVPAAPIATTKAATATTARSAEEIAASCAARPDKGEGDFFGGGPCAFVN
ncbi:hypothetical protein C8R43DRAFT_1170651 [Mycena crocata]|nr:hypothetical protein C8R43DRAFT_1170651 [Mycena crocata]